MKNSPKRCSPNVSVLIGTLRRAISTLVEQGLLRVEQGRGTFVAEDVAEFVVGERTRFTELLAAQKRTPGTQLIRAMEIPAGELVAENLKLRAGTKVYLIERLGEADSRPISIGTHYFPSRRVPGLIAAFEKEDRSQKHWRTSVSPITHASRPAFDPGGQPLKKPSF